MTVVTTSPVVIPKGSNIARHLVEFDCPLQKHM